MKSVVLLALFLKLSDCALVAINCTFPCKNPDQICQVTDFSIQCLDKTNNPKWVLESPTSLPKYQLSKVALGQICEIAPNPSILNNTVQSNFQTLINWPISNNYDLYYSNCGSELYCDKANICVKQLDHGQVCESNNQCLNGQCINSTCSNQSVNSEGGRSFTTIHMIIVIVGSILFISLIFGIFYYHKKRKEGAVNTKQQKDLEMPPNLLLENYSSPLPSSQQQQLQYQLQQLKNTNPPPYSP